MKLTLRVNHDSDTESPAEAEGQWTLHSFGRDHNNFKHPEDLGLACDHRGRPVVMNPGLRRKLEVGLAFFVSYFEHGSCVWSLQGTGPQCPFDNVQYGGLLVWTHKPREMGAKTLVERTADAKAFLATYTSWCNGETYWYDVRDEEGETIDSCGGYIGPDLDHMWESIAAAVGENDLDFEDGDHGSADDLRHVYERFLAKRAKAMNPVV